MRVSVVVAVMCLTLVALALDCGGTTTDTCADVTCAAGTICSSGQCVAICGAGTTFCNHACVDTQLDPQHCGNCDNVCPSGETCMTGSCSIVCPANETACGAVCVAIASDNMNCGACGTACATGLKCVQGKCSTECAQDLTQCGSQCVDTKTDLGNCGQCDTQCNVCLAGRCVLELVPPGPAAYGLTVANGIVYFVTTSEVKSVPKTKPFVTSEIYFQNGDIKNVGISIDSANTLFWSNLYGVTSYDGSGVGIRERHRHDRARRGPEQRLAI